MKKTIKTGFQVGSGIHNFIEHKKFKKGISESKELGERARFFSTMAMSDASNANIHSISLASRIIRLEKMISSLTKHHNDLAYKHNLLLAEVLKLKKNEAK